MNKNNDRFLAVHSDGWPKFTINYSRLTIIYLRFFIFISLPLLLAACGGNRGLGPPTAIPPDIVRPAQSTPEFVERRDPIIIPTLSPSPPEAANVNTAPRVAARATARVEAERVPNTAMGIANGNTTLFAAPAGNPLMTILAGSTVTVTGVSPDSLYYAAYTSAGQAGWIEATALTIFGGDNLSIVSNSYQPSALATTLALAMQPVNVLDQLVTQSTALPSEIDVNAVAASIVNAALSLPSFAVNDDGSNDVIGLVQSEGGTLNVRGGAGTEFSLIGQVGDGQRVAVVGFSDDGAWFEIASAEGNGWVAAQYVSLQ